MKTRTAKTSGAVLASMLSTALTFVLIVIAVDAASRLYGVLDSRLRPASWWLDVRSVTVDDATAGVPAVMHVDRTIRRDFRGRYHVEVERRGAGGFSLFCGAGKTGKRECDVDSSWINYQADNALPDPLDMDWWTYPVKYDLPPGSYRIVTNWCIDAGAKPDRCTEPVISNEFTIRSPAD